MNRTAVRKIAVAMAVAVALGLLEAAWTTPSAPGAARPMLGCLGIAIVFAAVSWPRLWWVPGLSMVEELVQIFAGQLPPVRPSLYDALFNHWSAAFTPINLCPYLSFPLVGVIGEVLYALFLRRTASRENARPRLQ